MNRQVWPSSLFPLRGDISAESGATSVTVTGLQGIPILSPPVEPAGLDTLFYDSYNNDWYYASPWILPVGTPLQWEGYGYGSSGISWIAPDTLAFGNGTDGDVSGAAAMTALVLFGSASYYGPYDDYDPSYGPSYDQFYTSIFSGATQNWNLILPPNPGTSGQVLTTNGTGVTYWGTVSGGGSTSPGGVPTNLQYNNSGVFGGIPGSSVDGVNGLVSIAPTGTGVALTLTSDGPFDDVQDWFVKGAATPGAVMYPAGDTVGMEFAFEDAAGDIIIINPILGYGIEYTDSPGNYTQIGRGTSAGTLNIFNRPSAGNAGQAALIVTGDPVHDVAWFCINSSVGASPAVSIQGSGAIYLANGLVDSTSSIGTNGQVLSSTISGVKWITISGGSPGGSSGDIQYNNSGAFGGSSATITAAGSITLPESQVIKWTGSAYSGVGLSILAADTLAVGNGNPSDVSGAMAMTALILYGSSYYSAYDAFQTTILSGATHDWALVLPETAGVAGQVLTNIGSGFTAWESVTTLGVPWSSLTNPTANLALTMGSDTTTFNYATGLAAAWAWANNTPTITGASTTLALSTSTAPTHSGGVSWVYTLAAAESGAGSNAWVGAVVTISGYTGGATGNNGASLVVTASTTTTVTVTNPTGTTVNTGTPVMISTGVSSSPVLQIAGTVNTGTAGTLNSVADVWSIQNVILSVQANPTSTLTFTHTGSSGPAGISAPAFICSTTSATNPCSLCNSNTPTYGFDVTSTGPIYVLSAGTIVLGFIKNSTTEALLLANTAAMGWSSGNPSSTTQDTLLSRNAAGILQIGTTALNALGSLAANSVAINGVVASPTAGVYYSGGTAGVSAGPFAAITSIQTIGGIVTTLADASDERLKDHSPYHGGLKEILGITPIKYTWNTIGQEITGFDENTLFVGFSAQDVQKAIPEAVRNSASNPDYLGFSDRPLIAALVNAIKELHAELQTLKNSMVKEIS